ncbi:hypothetical protein [Shewanella gaetbuli]|nr:hypothetical protein [Shewanella gaetbuli]
MHIVNDMNFGHFMLIMMRKSVIQAMASLNAHKNKAYAQKPSDEA